MLLCETTALLAQCWGCSEVQLPCGSLRRCRGPNPIPWHSSEPSIKCRHSVIKEKQQIQFLLAMLHNWTIQVVRIHFTYKSALASKKPLSIHRNSWINIINIKISHLKIKIGGVYLSSKLVMCSLKSTGNINRKNLCFQKTVRAQITVSIASVTYRLLRT